MRVAFFGSAGAMSLLPLQALAERHEVVAVIRAHGRRTLLRRVAGGAARALGLWPRDALASWARAHRIACLSTGSGSDPRVARSLRRLGPDLLCVSGFRYVLDPELLAIPRSGALNLHASLLPRHRGPVPWFWVYYRDDRVTGVTVHWMSERADAGDVLAQESFPLPRGLSVERLGENSARAGARLMAEAVAGIEADAAPRSQQDDTRATPAPAVRRGSRMVDFGAWGAERTWHFLAGLQSRFREPLFDAIGRSVDYSEVLGFELAAHDAAAVGRVARQEDRLALQCRDGIVWLSGGSAERTRT